jgi:L-lactate dehydrogenase complex protein LldG
VKPGELSHSVIKLLQERGIDAVLAWDSIPALDDRQLIQAGIKVIHSVDPAIKAGITGAAAAIAETGTLVIPSGKGQSLSTSLTPDIHIAVINSSQIVSSLEETMQIKTVREASATVLITGPSRTADIEMSLTIGAHGPKELVVYIIE